MTVEVGRGIFYYIRYSFTGLPMEELLLNKPLPSTPIALATLYRVGTGITTVPSIRRNYITRLKTSATKFKTLVKSEITQRMGKEDGHILETLEQSKNVE